MKLRSLTAAGVAAALLALAGCGGSSDGDSGSSGPVDLRMTIWSANAKHLALFDQIAADYKKDHPEVGKITFESIPFDSYTTTLTTQIGGGNVPDLAWIFESNAPAPPIASRYTALCSCSAFLTALPRPPLPMITFSPWSSIAGVNGSRRIAVVGPAEPMTRPGRAGVGPT